MTNANKALVWGSVLVAAVVLALTGYALLAGGDEETPQGKGGGDKASAAPSGSPQPSYSAPDNWTEPKRWAALPRGQRTDANDNEVSFPHSQNGAVAMLTASSNTDVSGDRSMVDEQVGIYDSYISDADRSAQNEAAVKEKAMGTDATMREELDLPAGGPLPEGAYSRSHAIAFRVIKASRDEVSVYVLSRVTARAGEITEERGSYSRTLLAAEWEGGDWKLSSAATNRAAQQAQGSAPAMAAPGDRAFNDAQWTAIREAS